jgi:hypothetical protein
MENATEYRHVAEKDGFEESSYQPSPGHSASQERAVNFRPAATYEKFSTRPRAPSVRYSVWCIQQSAPQMWMM